MARQYIQELWNKGTLEAADELVHAGSVNSSRPLVLVGPEGVKQTVKTWWEAFPDLRLFIQDVIAEQAMVALHLTLTGTHQGNFMGLPATGRSVEMEGCMILRFGDGQIVQRWVEPDLFGLLGQLGMGG
jgi:steroid delta-isomerase-like uncharacterized protein